MMVSPLDFVLGLISGAVITGLISFVAALILIREPIAPIVTGAEDAE